MKYEFPKNFKWGSAVWAQGTEGAFDKDGKAPTVWDEYYRLSPERFYNEVGPSETLNWYEDYERYAQLAKDIGHNSFRTSILWARLLPDGKNVNEKAVEFYTNMFKSFKEKGMELSIVLYWFDMPLLFEKQGGFTKRDVIEPFAYYCQKCFELFDGLVDIWYIYNEPIVDVMFKYQNDMCYPNLLDWNLANNAIYHMVVAHAKVVEVFKNGNYQGKIGSVLNHGHIYARSEHPADLLAKHRVELMMQLSYEEPLLLGKVNEEWLAFVKEYGAQIDVYEEDAQLIADNTISVLGLNIYSPERVKCLSYQRNPEAPITFDSFSEPYIMHGRQMNSDRGWEIYPKCLYDTLMLMKEEYGNPEMRITENGMGIQNEYRFRNKEGQIQDDYRIDYVKKHLIWAYKAIQEGVHLVGYNMWSFVDLWSPSNQFKNCYGFYEYDLKSGETKRKKSADWFEYVTKVNGFEE
ncbi:glycoside hydrolase family 1 protein [Candidatus Stoquefichus sp. SB1]|uniref:glycoside hydrolase family 1 protein n=1 Tax=Candidatus Stoquefichus sp. SB1 TaxID=1658109 RepID=UPI00067E7201|nr:glycoside hydrolase family 1 protein [Candidatus Stoquefichus sp. SB1]